MNLLYIEDEDSKAKKVVKVLKEMYPEFFITRVCSITSGIRKIREQQYNLVLIDMTLPLYDKGSVVFNENEYENLGGYVLLEEISRLDLNLKALVITAYDTIGDITLDKLDVMYKDEFKEFYIGYVQYSISSFEWVTQLTKNIEKLHLEKLK